MARALILGGTGFIGKHIVKAAQVRRWDIMCTSLSGKSLPGIESFQVDLTSSPATAEFLRGKQFDYVINCAGYIDHKPFGSGGRELIDQHLNIVMNVAQHLDRSSLKCFLQLGSSDEYGNNPAPQQEDMREASIAPYSFGKVASTHLLQMLHTTEGFPAVVARIFLAYGPGQDARRFLPQIIAGCLEGRTFPVSAGEQLRDFCFISDVVEGVLRCCESPAASGKVINIASGRPVTIREMMQRVRDAIGSGTPEFGKVPYRAGENMRLFASVDRARKLLGWEPVVDLDQGIRETIDYYRQSPEGKS